MKKPLYWKDRICFNEEEEKKRKTKRRYLEKERAQKWDAVHELFRALKWISCDCKNHRWINHQSFVEVITRSECDPINNDLPRTGAFYWDPEFRGLYSVAFLVAGTPYDAQYLESIHRGCIQPWVRGNAWREWPSPTVVVMGVRRHSKNTNIGGAIVNSLFINLSDIWHLNL